MTKKRSLVCAGERFFLNSVKLIKPSYDDFDDRSLAFYFNILMMSGCGMNLNVQSSPYRYRYHFLDHYRKHRPAG